MQSIAPHSGQIHFLFSAQRIIHAGFLDVIQIVNRAGAIFRPVALIQAGDKVTWKVITLITESAILRVSVSQFLILQARQDFIFENRHPGNRDRHSSPGYKRGRDGN